MQTVCFESLEQDRNVEDELLRGNVHPREARALACERRLLELPQAFDVDV